MSKSVNGLLIFYATYRYLYRKELKIMGIYLKLFNTHTQYESYTADTSNFILPNVSYCKDQANVVHYNPYVAPDIRLIAIFNVLNAPSEIKIMGYDEMEGVDAREYFSKIEIDGVEQPSVNYKYTFNTTGEHTIKYTLKDPTTIGGGTFQYLYDAPFSVIIPNSVITIDSWSLCANNLTSITIPNSVTSIGNYALSNCGNLTSITSNRTTAPTISSTTFQSVKTGGTLTVPIGSTGYNVWMGTSGYYLGAYGWTKVEQ